MRFSVHDQFRVQPAEGFGHMAIPADGTISGKDFREKLWRDILPFDGFMIRRAQRRSVIDMVQRAEGFVAERAGLALIPLRDNIPDEAVLWI